MSSKPDLSVPTRPVDRRLTSHFSLTVGLGIPCLVSVVLVLVQLLLWKVRKTWSGVQTPPLRGDYEVTLMLIHSLWLSPESEAGAKRRTRKKLNFTKLKYKWQMGSK